MIWITQKQLLSMHRDMIGATGGFCAVRDEGLLQSALSAPFQAFGDISLYPTIIEKAVRLGYGLTQNHPFIDGNKRIGVHAMLVVLALNGVELKYTQDELIEISLALASGIADYSTLLKWVKERIK